MTSPTPCAHCGACLPVCPVYRISGREDYSPRGRMGIIELGLKGGNANRSLAACLLCGACENVCSRGLDLTERIAAARKKSIIPVTAGITAAASPRLKKTFAPLARLLARAAKVLPGDSGLRLKPGLNDQSAAPRPPKAKEPPAKGTVAIFSGCFALYLLPEILAATVSLVRLTDGDAPYIAHQHCCGLAAFSNGDPERARDLARRNIAAFSGSGPVLTPCASCYHQLRQYPILLRDDHQWYPRAVAFAARVEEFAAFFTTPDRAAAIKDCLSALSPPQNIFWHDPCHLRFFGHDHRRESRQLLAMIPGLTVKEFSRGPHCCGMGGTFGIKFPDLSRRIIAPAMDELKGKKTVAIASSCSGCLIQWQRRQQEAGLDLEVIHPAILLTRLLR